MLFIVLYFVFCILKLLISYGVFLIGRILGGIVIFVLFFVFEVWYVYEYVEIYDFLKEWIVVIFVKVFFWNGLMVILVGFMINVFCDWMGFGFVVLYILVILFLVVVGVIVMYIWNENYSGYIIKFRKLCGEGFKSIVIEEKIFMLGVIEFLFESVIYIIIFLWILILEFVKFMLGVVFLIFMISILIG